MSLWKVLKVARSLPQAESERLCGVAMALLKHSPSVFDDLELDDANVERSLTEMMTKLDLKGTAVEWKSLLAAARAHAPLLDPTTQKFWFSAFGATSQEIGYPLFIEKFCAHFTETGFGEEMTKVRSALRLEVSVFNPFRNSLVGTCERISKAMLQDFIDKSTAFALPEAISSAIGELEAKVPPLCPHLAEILTHLDLDDAALASNVLRDNHLVFLELSKLSTSRLHQELVRRGVGDADSGKISLAVYMKHRLSLSNEITVRTKVEQAIVDLNNKCLSIDLSHCQLRDLHPVLSRFAEWNGVVSLNLASNNLHAEGVKDVIAVLQNQKVLRTVNLRGNNIQASGVQKICKLLTSHRSIRSIDLSLNHGTGKGAIALAQTLASTQVEELYFSGNDVDIEGIRELSNVLRQSGCRLTTLHLDSNSLGDDGIGLLCDALATNNCLRELSVAANGITEIGVERICQFVKKSGTIRRIDLSHNKFPSTSLKKLAESITNKRGLQVKCKGFSEVDLATLSQVNSRNIATLGTALKDLAHKPLPMWSVEDVCVWVQEKMGNPVAAAALKKGGIDGSRLRAYQVADLTKDGFDDEIAKLIFSFKETIVSS